MTPAEADQERRAASIRRAHRIDALDAGQVVNFIHRLAAIVPGSVDRVLAEFDANAPKPRSEPKLHPVTFYASDIRGEEIVGGRLLAYCQLTADVGWHEDIDDGASLEYLQTVVRRHSGIRP